MKKQSTARILNTALTLVVISVSLMGPINTITAVADTADFTQEEDIYSIESIVEASNVRATCQDSLDACIVEIDDEHNPYDVTWDFGEKWNRYVELCDWSKVFDASYYKKAYPMLAVLYNNDDDLLLEHFATVGVHEGRQGCKDFNVEAYLMNSQDEVYEAFHTQVEGAYVYYMLNYETEKNVNTVTREDGKEVRTQLFNILTATQRKELEGINKYRSEAEVDDVEINGELCALANYRAYVNRINRSDLGEGHDWARNNMKTMIKYMEMIDEDAEYLDENTITGKTFIHNDMATMYYNSKEHREAMLKDTSTIVGISNFYHSKDDYLYSEFDIFMP